MPSTRITLPGGETVPRLGQGTWHMGEAGRQTCAEIAALREGIDLGMTLIDTAEMYGDGGAEEIVGRAIQGRRDDVFLVSKVYPHNAGKSSAISACERSLRRMNVDTIDLYLLHWRGSIPLNETVEAFERLIDSGKVRYFGVSNFDVDDLEEWVTTPGADRLVTNQVLYNLERRWPEWALLDWCRARELPVMAYTPLEPVRHGAHPVLEEIAARHDAAPAQIALAWVLAQTGTIAIPKAATQDHVRANARVTDIVLDQEDLDSLDAVWPPPDSHADIEML